MSVRPITETLNRLRGGLFVDECSEKLAGVVKSVEETGKAGRITITIDLKKSAGALAITAKVTDKTPEAAPEADLLWATVEGNLTPQNPNQRSLQFGEVDRSTGEILVVPAQRPPMAG